ncbi:SAM-dependent methyltransferase [Mycolicibacterium thermoresistibile]
MPESSAVVRPVPMESSSYTAGSRLEAAGLREAIRLFEQAADTVPLPRAPQPIVIADYGAATGHNSLRPICAAIDVVRRRTSADHSVLVTHTDVPENDFSALFDTLNNDPDTYLKHDPASFSSAVGRSFFDQILPSNSVNLGWSAWAIQWLNRVPSPVPDHLVSAGSTDDAVRAAYAKQAAQDWQAFIAYRGRELAPNGRLVVMTMALHDSGEFGHRPLLAALRDTLAELKGAGVITADEWLRMGLPIIGRSAADFLAPFAPSGRYERLEIEHLEVFDAVDRYFTQYRVDGDAAAFGAQWGAFCRAAVFPALVSTLTGDPTEFCDRLEAGIAARMAADPQESQLPMALLVLVKRPRTV